jgi:hypothetical protein
MASSQLQVHMELNDWTAHYWQTHPLGLAPLYSLGVFVPGGLPVSELATGYPPPDRISPVWTFLSAALGLICLLAAVLHKTDTHQEHSPHLRREIALEAAFLFLPLLALLAASLVVTPVYVLTRTDALAFPAFVLLMGRGLAHLPGRAAGGILLFWVAISLYALAPTYGFGNLELAKNTDRRLAREMAADGLAPDDWVVHTFMTAPSIEYYLDRFEAPHQTAWFPRVAEENMAAGWPTPVDSLSAYQAEALQLRREMDASLPEDGMVWIFGLIQPSAAEAIVGGSAPKTLTVEQIGYPVSVLVYALVRQEPVVLASIYRQNWVGGTRVVLRIPRASWVADEVLPLIDEEVQDELRP